MNASAIDQREPFGLDRADDTEMIGFDQREGLN